MQSLRPRPWLGRSCAWRAMPGIVVACLIAPTAVSAEAGPYLLTTPASGSAVQQIAVFGTDDRVILPSKFQPMREMIGVLFNIRQRTVCSAFCVGPSTIGTAAHCLFKTSGEKPPRLADFWFARNYDEQRDYARVAGYETGAAGQNVMAGSTTLSTTPPIDATRDWAFVRLSRSVCTKGSFEVEAAPVEQVIREAANGRIYQISYHRDFKQWKPAYSKPCRVDRGFANVAWPTIAADFNGPENLLLHTCDTGGASSGSPLLMDTPQGPRVIGINVGTYVQSKTMLQNERIQERISTDAIANTGVAATAFARQLAAFKTAHILVGVSHLRELQDRLQKAGYYSGPTDGTFGPALRQAIETYEAVQKLPMTGLASEDLLARLRLGPGSSSR